MTEASLHNTQELDHEPDTRPLVSIVIVSWNALETVKKCLPSVAQSSYENFEILFADNASTDGSAEWIAEHFPSVRIVRHPENWAFCRGNNEAVRKARGTYVVLLNNDVEVTPDWLDPLVEHMELNPHVGAVQPKLLSYQDRTRFEYAGGAGGFLDRYGFPFTRGRLFFTLEQDEAQYDSVRNIFWATGAALMTRKAVYDELGGLDERLFMHMEEIDFCWRLQRRGYTIVCQPLSQVFHIGAASLKQGSTRKVFLNYRNNLLVLFKNLSRKRWRRVLVARIMLDGIAMLRAVLMLRPGESVAIFRAYMAAHKMKSSFEAERPALGEQSVDLPYQGNIVVDYFLLRRRVFSQLSDDKFRL